MAQLPARHPRNVKEDYMSVSPTPRLGRAVRLFTPVVLAGTLTVPLLAGASDHGAKHHWPSKPAAPAAATASAQPSASADAVPTVADDSAAVTQEQSQVAFFVQVCGWTRL